MRFLVPHAEVPPQAASKGEGGPQAAASTVDAPPRSAPQDEAAKTRPAEPILLQTLGELENSLATTQMAFRELVENANGYDFEPSVERANRALIRKTLAANAAIATVNKAVELVGGSAYFRRGGLERLLRDVQAAPYHPLPEKRQLDFTGRVALGLPPVQ